MNLLQPFPTRIVRPDWAEQVVSPMHDSLTPEERAAIMAERPYSWLHVSRTPEDGDEAELAELEQTAFRRLLEVDAFERFAEPALYVYRIATSDHMQTGIVGEVPHEAFVEDRVLGHEGVQAERLDAVERHLDRVGAASTLVALMFRADEDIRKIVDAATDEPPLRRFTTGDLAQTVWRIADPEAVERIRERLEGSVLYITDGHHRAKASVDLWERAGRPAGGGVPAVLFPDDELRMLGFHRRIPGPLAEGPEEVLDRVRARADVRPSEAPVRERGAFGLYLDGRWHRIELPPNGVGGGVGSLDVTRLHRELIQPVFGFDPSGDGSIEFVPAAVPVDELTRRVDEDRGAAFTLSPPTFEQFVDVADRHEEMPPKATFFDPKPQAGLFLRIPDDEAG